MKQPSQVTNIDYQNNQPVMFPTHVCPHVATEALKFVVIMNHLDKRFFIARTTELKTYMLNLAYFLLGSPRFCTSIELHRARTPINLAYWSVEVLEAADTDVERIRSTFSSEWRGLGTKSHQARLGGVAVIIYKVTHKKTGWSRYGSYRQGRTPNPEYMAKQALLSLAEKNNKKRNLSSELILMFDVTYRNMCRDFERDPTSWEIAIVKIIPKEEESAKRPLDIVKELNVAVQVAWEASTYKKHTGEQK